MKPRKLIFTIIIAIIYFSIPFTVTAQNVEPIAKDIWIGMDMGAGGYFNNCEAGPSGIILLNGDLSGTYMSRNRGNSWVNIGFYQGLTETHACGLGFDPVDSTVMFIGTEKGLYRSFDTGKSFTKVYNGIYFTDIAISGSNHLTGYAGGNSKYNLADGAVYKTFDNGVTWAKVSTDLPLTGILIQEIIINPNNPDTLYVHSYSNHFVTATKALYKSTNGGVNWSEVAPDVLNGKIFDIAIDPSDFRRMYASGTTIGVAKSTDGGDSWVTNKTNYSGSLHIKEDMPDVLRLLRGWNWMESTDSGETWVAKPYWPESYFLPSTQWGGARTLKGDDMSDSDTYFWINDIAVWASFDGGKTIHPLWTKEKTPGSGWWITTGVENSCPWDLAISEADPNVIYQAYWDMGLWRSLDHGQYWQSCNNTDLTGAWSKSVNPPSKQGIGGNSRTVCADPVRANVVWASIGGDQTDPQKVYKSSNYGQFDSWVATTGLPATYLINGLSVDYNSDPANRTLFVTALGDIYKSMDDGMTWSTVSTGLNCQYTMVDRFDTSFVYAGGTGGFFRSADEGETWSKTGMTEMTAVYDIKTDPSNQDWLYVVCCGIGKGLYLSKDKGLNWEKILADDFLRGVAVDSKNPLNLYAASSSAVSSGGYKDKSTGIQYTRDGGVTWIPANEGVSWPFAYCVEVDPEDNSYVFAGMPGMNFKKRQFSDISVSSVSEKKDEISSELLIYPNPARKAFTVKIRRPGNYNLVINDIAGRKIYESTNINEKHIVDCRNFPVGIYLILVSDKKSVLTKKLFKE